MSFSIETYIQLYCRIWDMSEQILDPWYRFHHIDDLNEVSRMLLVQECFHTVLERAMGNPAIPVLYTYMVPCGLCTACVGKRIWPLFFKVSINVNSSQKCSWWHYGTPRWEGYTQKFGSSNHSLTQLQLSSVQ